MQLCLNLTISCGSAEVGISATTGCPGQFASTRSKVVLPAAGSGTPSKHAQAYTHPEISVRADSAAQLVCCRNVCVNTEM